MDQLDLKKIQSIPHPKSIAIMNQYLHTATQHINKISDYSQKQLLEIDFMIGEFENKVIILQRKIGITLENNQKIGQDNQENRVSYSIWQLILKMNQELTTLMEFMNCLKT